MIDLEPLSLLWPYLFWKRPWSLVKEHGMIFMLCLLRARISSNLTLDVKFNQVALKMTHKKTNREWIERPSEYNLRMLSTTLPIAYKILKKIVKCGGNTFLII